MFYFENFNGKRVLKSDFINEVQAFFSTREGFDEKFLNAHRIIKPDQTHSDHVVIADSRKDYPDTDGVIIRNSNDAIFMRFADCTPIIFYNPKNKMAAIAHAGWRGTVGKIAIKTVEKMECDPKDIVAVIGPAIGLCCYEVSEDVKQQLLSTVKLSEGLYNNRNVDLKRINARQLEEIGVKKVDICPYCTSCDNDLFFSYRKENGTSNRHFAVIKL